MKFSYFIFSLTLLISKFSYSALDLNECKKAVNDADLESLLKLIEKDEFDEQEHHQLSSLLIHSLKTGATTNEGKKEDEFKVNLFLIQMGADMNFQDNTKNNNSPLFLSIYNGDIRFFELLKLRKADFSLKRHGKTALEYAQNLLKWTPNGTQKYFNIKKMVEYLTSINPNSQSSCHCVIL